MCNLAFASDLIRATSIACMSSSKFIGLRIFGRSTRRGQPFMWVIVIHVGFLLRQELPGQEGLQSASKNTRIYLMKCLDGHSLVHILVDLSLAISSWTKELQIPCIFTCWETMRRLIDLLCMRMLAYSHGPCATVRSSSLPLCGVAITHCCS